MGPGPEDAPVLAEEKATPRGSAGDGPRPAGLTRGGKVPHAQPRPSAFQGRRPPVGEQRRAALGIGSGLRAGLGHHAGVEVRDGVELRGARVGARREFAGSTPVVELTFAAPLAAGQIVSLEYEVV
ncbi:hypothetical protein ACWCYZ_07995 [Streptomyces virginiae]